MLFKKCLLPFCAFFLLFSCAHKIVENSPAPKNVNSLRTPYVPSNEAVFEPDDIGERNVESRSEDRPNSFVFNWPLKEPKVTSYFGWRRMRGKEKLHEGIDLQARIGTPVYASAGGRVLYVGRKIRGFGKIVVLEHQDTWVTVYAHLSKYVVRSGSNIRAGSLIGYTGKTGRVKGPHLHFEIRKFSDPLDPLLYLPPL